MKGAIYVRVVVGCEKCYNMETDAHPPPMTELAPVGDTEGGVNSIYQCDRCGTKAWLEVAIDWNMPTKGGLL